MEIERNLEWEEMMNKLQFVLTFTELMRAQDWGNESLWKRFIGAVSDKK